LLNQIGTTLRHFRYLLARRDQNKLDCLFSDLEQVPDLNSEKIAALSWYSIAAAREAGEEKKARDMLLELAASTGRPPLIELELYHLRHSQDSNSSISDRLEMAELRLLETRPIIIRAKLELEAALEDLCRKRGIDFTELMSLFEQIKVERAGDMLDKLNEALPQRSQYDSMSLQEAAVLWQRSLLHRRKSGETRQELALLEKLIEAFPDNILYLHNAGVAALNLERYEAAEQYLNAAYNLSGNDYPLALCSLGLLYARKGDKAKSREYLARLEAEGGSQHSLDVLSHQINAA